MPIVAIKLTPKETARVDLVAAKQKRARKQQVHILFLLGLETFEFSERQTAALKPQPKKQ